MRGSSKVCWRDYGTDKRWIGLMGEQIP